MTKSIPSPTSPSPRAAVYCRVSDPDAADKYGMDTQEAECRTYASARGWAVTTVYREYHTGADLFERPHMTELRAAMRRREFDVLLVHRLDRLSRDVNHQGYVLSEAEHAGVAWESATEDLSDPLMGGILRAVIGAFAEMDRLKITANTARGRREKAEQGRPLGQGKPRYGLAWAGDKMGCVEDSATVGHLQRIFRDYDRGLSLRALGIALEADGILPPYHDRTGATRWGASTIRDILTDRAYIGQAEAFRTISTRERNDRGEKVRRHHPRPVDDRVTLPPGTVPVVIDPVLFARVQTRLEHNKRESCRRDRNPQVGILRRGYAVCGGCGHPLIVLVSGRSEPYYRCHTDGKRLWACPGTGAIPVNELDTDIWTWLTVELADEERVRWRLDQMQRDEAGPADDLATVERHLKQLTTHQANVAEAVAQLSGNRDAMAPLLAKLDALGRQRRAAEQDRADVLARQAHVAAVTGQVRDIQDHCRTVAAQMATVTDYADRRAMLDTLGVKVTLYPAAHQPRWTATSIITPQGITSGNLYSDSACIAGT